MYVWHAAQLTYNLHRNVKFLLTYTIKTGGDLTIGAISYIFM